MPLSSWYAINCVSLQGIGNASGSARRWTLWASHTASGLTAGQWSTVTTSGRASSVPNMARFNVKLDDKEWKRLTRELSPSRSATILQRSTNVAMDRTYTQLVRRVADETKLKPKYVREKTQKIPASKARIQAQIVATGRQALNLIEWAGRDLGAYRRRRQLRAVAEFGAAYALTHGASPRSTRVPLL